MAGLDRPARAGLVAAERLQERFSGHVGDDGGARDLDAPAGHATTHPRRTAGVRRRRAPASCTTGSPSSSSRTATSSTVEPPRGRRCRAAHAWSLGAGSPSVELADGSCSPPTQIVDVAARRRRPVHRRGGLMLLRLLRSTSRRTAAWLAAVVVLQFVGVVAMLYLPSLNADIIDNGVATGDTGYILRTGAMMLGGLAGADRLLGRRRLLRRPHRDGASAATCARRSSTGSARSPTREVAAVRRAVADHPQHQRRAAGADAGADDLHDRGRPRRS